MDHLRFHLNGHLVEEFEVSPTTTLLNYMRWNLGLTGSKEGCAEGDCGACTVVVIDPDAPGGPTYRAINACLVLLPMVQGKQVVSVEGLRQDGAYHSYHAVQDALVEELGSQCGYCTPGIIMAMFEACYRTDLDEAWKLDDQMAGNLCLCTGYRPIRDAARKIGGLSPDDGFKKALSAVRPESMALRYSRRGQIYTTPTTFDGLFDALEAQPNARLVCGGTDLSLEVTKLFKTLKSLVSIEGIAELRRVEQLEDHWHIGATVTLTDLESANL